MSVHAGLRLYTSPENYLFEPLEGSKEVFQINRDDESLSLLPQMPRLTEREKIMTVHGIVGLISLHSSTFLIVITARKEVAKLRSHPIYMATDFRLFPVQRGARPSVEAHPEDGSLLQLLKNHLYSAPFYFSYGWDLTSSFQRQARLAKEGGDKLPLWQRADERFFWNRFVAKPMIEATSSGAADLSRFILPLVFGFLAVKHASINGRGFVYGLLGRRSRHRAGTRYFSRGVDVEGNVSNFNESEQFVLADVDGGGGGGADEKAGGKELESERRVRDGEGSVVLSYVQTRGSVPVFWAEVNNLRYKPDLLIMDKHETEDAISLHFKTQVSLYGDVYVANTVNQKGYERPVKDAYEEAISKLGNPRVHYTYFDFHHECKGMRFQNVMKLVERLEAKGLKGDNYFSADKSGVKQMQTAVLRTNCMDCLDRTNVVQSTFARWMLNVQLRSVGVLRSESEKLEDHAAFWSTFRNAWADHADVVSKAYSGTGALKTDFTRMGRRTYEGALQDGVNSLTRYVRNNFLDGARQDAFDLFTGGWTPSRRVQRAARPLAVRAAPYAWLAVFVAMLAVLFGGVDFAGAPQPVLLGVLVSLNLVLAHWITERGLEYVAWPSLNRPESTMYYDGPGYSSGRHGRAAVPSQFARNQRGPSRVPREYKPKEDGSGRRGYAAE